MIIDPVTDTRSQGAAARNLQLYAACDQDATSACLLRASIHGRGLHVRPRKRGALHVFAAAGAVILAAR
jgi:hypothetical protein